MTNTNRSWLRRSLSLLLVIAMVLSLGVTSAFAEEAGTAAASTEATSTPAADDAGEVETSSNAVTISDENLRKAICTALNKDYTEGVTITEAEMASITELIAPNAGITDLTGLAYAENLVVLNLSGNDLSACFEDYGREFYSLGKTLRNLVTLNLSDCKIGSGDNEMVFFMVYGIGASAKLETIDFSGNGLYGLLEFTVASSTHITFDALKTVDLSDNDLYGVSFTKNYSMKSLEKIDLRQNRVYPNENSGDWYTNAVSIGLEHYDFSEQKSFTELHAISVNDATDWTTEGLDNENNVITLPDTFKSSVDLKLQGYEDVQTVSGINDSMELPVRISAPSTEASGDDSLFTLELKNGLNEIPLTLTHISGETKEYTIKITVNSVPAGEGDDWAGITDYALQKAVCGELDKDPATYVVTKADMETLTSIVCSEISEVAPLYYATNLTYLNLTLNDNVTSVDMSHWGSLQDFSVIGGSVAFTGTNGISKSMESLIIYADLEDTDLGFLSELSDLRGLTLVGDLETAPDLSKNSSLSSLTITQANDGSLPNIAEIQGLKSLSIYGFDQSTPLSIPDSSSVYWLNIYEANGTVKINGGSKLTGILVHAVKDGDVTIDLSGVEKTDADCELQINSNDGGGNGRSVVLNGSCDFVEKMEISDIQSLQFGDSFSAKGLTELKIDAVDYPNMPSAGSVPSLGTLSVTSATGVTEWFAEINEMTSLTSIDISYTPFENLDSLDLSKLTSLTSLSLGGSKAIKGTLDISKLPNTLMSLMISNTGISKVTGKNQFDSLMVISLAYDRLVEFPTELLRSAPNAFYVLLSGNLYTEVPENAFENNTSIYTLQLGSWIPVIEKDGDWIPDPDTETGKTIAAIKEKVSNFTLDIGPDLGIVSGDYCGLVDISSDDATVSGDVFVERTIRVMASPNQEAVGLTFTPLLDDTVITINGEAYEAGETYTVDINQMKTELTVTCSNPYTNYLVDTTETTYKVQIISGSYMESFEPEEGHYYEVSYSLRKNDGSFSMADAYFTDVAQVKYENGKYEIRFTTTSADLITGMRYKSGETAEDADITSESGKTRTYRIYADSLDKTIDITPRVAPMGNTYATCYMIFDLEQVMDITESMDVDTADLTAAISKATAITDKRNVYTTASYSAMLSALAEAEKIAALSAPTQSAVDEAQSALTAAIDALVVDESKLADKTTLASAIADAKALEKGSHTDTAWNALQDAITDAQSVYDTLEASQSEVDSAVKALNNTVTVFNSSGDSSTLDKNKLEDGVYSVYGEMIKMNRTEKSMSNDAINHTIKLTVEDGKYYITMDFKGLTYLSREGYLAELSYYEDGYSYGTYGAISGTRTAATVLSTQKDADGNDVMDEFNKEGGTYAGKLYPDQVKFPLVASALADADGYVPLHVFVPVMEDISAGNGDQDVLLKLDWSTLKKTTETDPGFDPDKPVVKSPAVNYTDKATGITVSAGEGVLPEGVVITVTTTDVPASAADKTGNKKAYTVTFTDAEGNAVTQNDLVTVGFPVPKNATASQLTVYRDATRSAGTLADGVYSVPLKDVTGTLTLVSTYQPFSDVAYDRYYYEPVIWAVENGITNGIGSNLFGTSNFCTRAEIVTFLWRAAGQPEPTSSENPFSDVAEGRFYYKAVLWAVENGITNGYDDGRFGPDDVCTRSQIVTFMYRAAGEPEVTSTNPFTDVIEGKFYYNAVLWAVENGITNGTGNGFEPDNTCSRVEAVAFIQRYDSLKK